MRTYRARMTIELDIQAPSKKRAREWVLENSPMYFSRRQPEYGFAEFQLESDPDSLMVEILPKQKGKG